jgi:putative heme-binding domain-containing protein
LARRQRDTSTSRAALAEYESLLAGGDPARGKSLFFGNKATCSTCHQVDGAGGKVGPDLTRIGAVRTGAALLESVFLPSSTLAQGYESYTLATADGRVVTGVIARQSAGLVILRDSSGAESRFQRAEIEELRRSETSLMPEGLGRVLTREELKDLLAFLQAQK